MVQTHAIADEQLLLLLARQEGHFSDFKSKRIIPAKLSKSISAMGNADGGELFVGIEEASGTFKWDGFANYEEANALIQMIEKNYGHIEEIKVEALSNENHYGYVYKIEILKNSYIVETTDGKIFKRLNAQNLQVSTHEQIKRLSFEKGVSSYEDTTTQNELSDVTNSITIIKFMVNTIPLGEPEEWLKKQKLIVNEKPTIAAELLFSDYPQATTTQAIAKIYRYKTSEKEGTRETLDFVPINIEGPLYDAIEKAIDQTVNITESIPILSEDQGFEKISYPRDAIHEVICNAFIHRDYALNDYVHIRIFDNRIEVENPGRLPGHITERNILRERFIRNKKVTRLLNKFPNPPNQDVGEGLNTAFNAMRQLKLKEPEVSQGENSVIIFLRHEKLASLEEMIRNYLMQNGNISNMKAREVFHEPSESKVRKTFQAMRSAGILEVVPGTRGKGTAYRLTELGKQEIPE